MRRIGCLCLALMLCALSFAGALAEDKSVEDQLAALFRRFSTLGASVAVFQNGHLTYTYCYGVRSAGGGSVTPDTGFQVGSISKMVANIGLMQLLEENGISLDSELGDILGYPVRSPEYPNTPVTLRQLMTHTAALRDSGYYQLALDGSPRALGTLFRGSALVYLFEDWEPGSRRSYTNFGGGLIGCLIEKLSGQTLDDYMTENVFAPLGIIASYEASLLPESMPLADMYQMPGKVLTKALREDETLILLADPEHDYFLTAGKLIITAPDLCRILIALCDGGIYENTRILKESTVKEMTTRQNYIGSVSCESGHGLFMNIITDDEVESRTLYGHGGKANGMLCAAYFDPTDRTGVVMLTNGCNNTSVYNGVGLLGRLVLTLCYEEIIGSDYTAVDPFLVDSAVGESALGE